MHGPLECNLSSRAIPSNSERTGYALEDSDAEKPEPRTSTLALKLLMEDEGEGIQGVREAQRGTRSPRRERA